MALTPYYTKAESDALDKEVLGASANGIISSINTSSAVPTQDGLYPCTESGTYTNFGGEVVSLDNQIVSILVENNLATFTQIVSQITTPIANTLDLINDSEDLFTGRAIHRNIRYKADLEVGKNLFNINDSEISIGSFVSSNGVLLANASYNVTGYIPITPSTQHVVSYKHHIGYYDENKVFISLSLSSEPTPTVSPVGAYYARCTVLASTEWSEFQFELGTVATSFEPYSLTISSDNLDLTALSTKEDLYRNTQYKYDLLPGTNLFNINDSDIAIGSFLSSQGGLISNASYNVTGYIKILPSTQYTVSYKHHVAYYDESLNFISFSNSTETNPILTSPSGAYYIKCTVLAATEWSEFQFQVGSSETPFEPYSLRIDSTNAINEVLEKFDIHNIQNYSVVQTSTVLSLDIIDYKGLNLDFSIEANYQGLFGVYSRDINNVATLLYKSDSLDFQTPRLFNATIPNDAVAINIRTFQQPVTITEFKISTYRIKERFQVSDNQHFNKVESFYGDSITAISNGDWQSPFTDLSKWALVIADKLKLSSLYVRGIGGQRYAWGSNGGAVCFINSDGTHDSRNNSYNYDNYLGNVSVPSGTTPVRGAYSSWLRITTMYPSTIKDSIDVVYIMGATNDVVDSTSFSFISNDTTDTEWSNSSEYSTFGGDFNITTLEGGIASTIMKFQAWMPQARIVLITPLSGRGVTGQLNMSGLITQEYTKSVSVRKIASIMSIPIIDVNAECGINGLNRTDFLTDQVHPYNTEGNNALAMTILGGAKKIYPRI